MYLQNTSLGFPSSINKKDGAEKAKKSCNNLVEETTERFLKYVEQLVIVRMNAGYKEESRAFVVKTKV